MSNVSDRAGFRGVSMGIETRKDAGLLAGVLLAGLVIAGPVPAEVDTRAAEAYASENWRDAAAGYQELVAQDPENGRYWYRLSVSLRQLGRFEPAQDALERAAHAGVPASFIAAERARRQLAQGDQQQALKSVQDAVSAGLGADAIANDPDLAVLRSRPEWGDLIERARRQAEPCNYDPRFREFDFWAGDWEVRAADGTLAGNNRISREELGCVLIEHWEGASGGTGTSLNYFDPVAGRWVQRWVGVGVLIDISGRLEGGSMRLAGHVHYIATGDTRPFRGTWTLLDDGRVRQFFEESLDQGQSWQPWFEGFYSRKPGH